MSPIKGLSEQVRIPRLGKIHLGYKDEKKKGAPTATDYFVCPPEVVAVYGEKPTSLPIMIPVEDEDIWASQYYRAYSNTRGLTCRGDGITCRRMIDTETGDMANRDTKQVAWKEGNCTGHECPDYQEKKCSEKMCLQFMLPEVPGIGVWQIDTGSISSIRNINGFTKLIRSTSKRIEMIPLILSLGAEEKISPEDGKKKNVFVLHLGTKLSLPELLAVSEKPFHQLLAPPPVDNEAPRDVVEEEVLAVDGEQQIKQAEKDIENLWDSQEGKPPIEQEVEDTDWYTTSLKKIKWADKTVTSYLGNKYQVDKAGTIFDVIGRLNQEQEAEFVQEINDRLKML